MNEESHLRRGVVVERREGVVVVVGCLIPLESAAVWSWKLSVA